MEWSDMPATAVLFFSLSLCGWLLNGQSLFELLTSFSEYAILLFSILQFVFIGMVGFMGAILIWLLIWEDLFTGFVRSFWTFWTFFWVFCKIFLGRIFEKYMTTLRFAYRVVALHTKIKRKFHYKLVEITTTK